MSFIRRSLYVMAIAGVLSWLPVEALAGVVSEARLWSSNEQQNTRLVLELSADTPVSLFALSNPDRLVIDLPDTRLSARLPDLDLSGSPITKIRSGVHNGDDLRIVLDLNQSTAYRHFLLPAQGNTLPRLVLDLPFTADTAPAVVKAQMKHSPAKTIVGRDVVIVVDPGHGGKDPGAIGASGTYEKDVVLAISRRIRNLLNEAPGFMGVLTRGDDRYIPLRGRLKIARQRRADFFVSIHADAVASGSPQGSSVYALSLRGASSETAKWLAERENNAGLLTGAEETLALGNKDATLKGVLLDLSMSSTLNSSLAAGGGMVDKLGRVNPLHKKRVEQAAFVVLKSPDIPSLLVETGFISTASEERKLRDPAHQQRLAEAVVASLVDYFEQNPPPGTLLAEKQAHPAAPEPDAPAMAAARSYQVKPGDTLATISAQSGISLSTLSEQVSIEHLKLAPGQTLNLPSQ